MTTLLQSIAHFVSEIRLEDCPKKEIHWATLALTDFFAVTFPRVQMPVAKNVKDFFKTRTTVGKFDLIGSEVRTDAISAAIFNGTASHCLDTASKS